MSALVLLVTVFIPALLGVAWRRPKPARVPYPRASHGRGRDDR